MPTFSKENFPYSIALQHLAEQSRNKYESIYNQWVQVGTNLAQLRSDPQGHAFEHIDANIDLVLRGLEEEQALCFRLNDDKLGGGVFFLQLALSKSWLFSIYEALRMSAESPCPNQSASGMCENATECIRCAIQPLKSEFAIHRVPLAKLKPASKEKTHLQNYHNSIVINDENGSIGWRSKNTDDNSTHTTSRLDLSNKVLRALGTPFPSP